MSSATRDMDVESQNSVEMPTASPVMVRDMDVESQNSVEMASMPSIQDLQMDNLEDSRINPSRFGQIVRSEYTQPDPLMDAQREVITQGTNMGRASGVLLAAKKSTRKSAKKSGTKSAKKTRKTRRYHYVKQGKKCKKVISQYKKVKCKGKRSKKCRPLQRKRKTCKKIIKHKKAMAKRSRKMMK